jgi:hypothetical protein
MKQINFDSDNVFEQKKEIQDDENYFVNLVSRKYLNKEIVIAPMFSVPILHIKMSNWDHKKKQLMDMFFSNQNQLRYSQTVNTTYIRHESLAYLSDEEAENIRVWENDFIKSISNIFQEERKIIYECFGNPTEHPQKTCYVGNCWFQEQKKGMFHPPHTHGFCGLSAVCFVNYDKNEHTATEFLSPHTSYDTDTHEYYVPKDISSGSLIVFPSNIIHYTHPHNSENSRIILSINIRM